MSTHKEFAEAFTIFAKYEPDGGYTSAGHDEISSGPSPDIMSDEDKKRLMDLGWWVDGEYDCWGKFT